MNALRIVALLCTLLAASRAFSGDDEDSPDSEYDYSEEKPPTSTKEDDLSSACCKTYSPWGTEMAVASVFETGRFRQVSCPSQSCCESDRVVAVRHIYIYQMHCLPKSTIKHACVAAGEYIVNTVKNPDGSDMFDEADSHHGLTCCPGSSFKIEVGEKREDQPWNRHLLIQCVKR